MKRLLSVALLLLFALPLFAQEQKQMTAEEKAMMDAWMKAATPGAAQKVLDDMVGTFATKSSWWAAPGATPVVSEGVSENKWILGGRVVEQHFTGTSMGMPFEGLGYTGYDNTKKQYWGTWMDNAATGVMTSTGSAAAGGKVFNFDATMTDPMSGKDSKVKEKIYVKSRDEQVFEMWMPGKDGKMFKTMEIVYKRKK
jgi:hypothetical protein